MPSDRGVDGGSVRSIRAAASERRAADTEIERMIARMAAGDRSALGPFYDKTAAQLMGVCMLILADRTLAATALQEAYVAIWRRAPDYSPGDGAMPWLASIARTHALAKRPGVSDAAALPCEIEPGIAALAIARLPDGSALKRRLSKLPARHAQAIVLAYIHGLTHRQLATALDTSPSIARDLVTSGLAGLRTDGGDE